jgi:hypothetical protein
LFEQSLTWEAPHEGAGDQCEQPFEQTDGQRIFLPDDVVANVSVSEEDWAKIRQVAKDAAAEIDATDVQVMHDQPGNHDVWFSGPPEYSSRSATAATSSSPATPAAKN